METPDATDPDDIYDVDTVADLDPLLADLPDKQKRFVVAYCGEARFCATRAATLAGYKHPKEAGYRLKQDANIRKAIDARLDAETLSSQEIMARWTEIANASLSDYYVVNPGQEPFVRRPLPSEASPLVDDDNEHPFDDENAPIPVEGTRNRVVSLSGTPAHLQEDLVGAAKLGYLHLVEQIKETRYGRQIILYNRKYALDRLARAQGMLSDLPSRREEALLNAILDALPDELRDAVEQHINQALQAQNP